MGAGVEGEYATNGGEVSASPRCSALDLVDLAPAVLHQVVVALTDVLELLRVLAAQPGSLHHTLELLQILDLHLGDERPVALGAEVGHQAHRRHAGPGAEFVHGLEHRHHGADLARLTVQHFANEQHRDLPGRNELGLLDALYSPLTARRSGAVVAYHPSPAARTIRNNPAPRATAAVARATRSPAGARRSTVMAAATTAIARTFMTPMTRRMAIRPTQHWLQWRPRLRPCRQAVPASAGTPSRPASRQQAR